MSLKPESPILFRIAKKCDNLPEGVGGPPSANWKKKHARTSGSLSPPKKLAGLEGRTHDRRHPASPQYRKRTVTIICEG